MASNAPAVLADLRLQIDKIDLQMLGLLNQRAGLAAEVAKVKISEGEQTNFYRPEREIDVLRRVVAANGGPLSSDAVARLFREIMSECLALERPLAVAFLGPEGTFTQQAALTHFGQAIQAVPLPAIDEIFRAVESGTCQYGVVPVENSTEGVITHTLDSFLDSSLQICGEVALRVHHNLMSHSAKSDEIEVVYSHQQSLAQCRGWLDRYLPWAHRSPVSSNAEAARRAASEPKSAAIAGEVAANLYGLPIVEPNIEDEPDNTTRFLVIGRQAVEATGSDKTSLLITTRNEPGSLHKALEPFARFEISMTKIESRPSRQAVWDYVFFIDIEGHGNDSRIAEALAAVSQHVSLLKVLGSYPRGSALLGAESS